MEKSQNRKPFQALRDLFHPVDLTHGTCWRTILQFSLPVILSYLLQQVYTISDAAIVGQTLTAQEVAGVNDTSSLVFIFLQFAFGVSAGFCVITSCCVGCRDQAGVRRSMAAQLVLSAGLTVLLTALALVLLNPMLAWINVTPENPEVYRAAYTYCGIIFAGIGAQLFYNFICSFLRSMGDSVTPLLFLLGSTVLNVALDLLFILVLHWGVAGAAGATVTAQLISTVACFAYAFSKYPDLRLHKEDWRITGLDLKRHIVQGVPLGLQFSVLAIGIIVMQSVVVKFDMIDGQMVSHAAQNGFGAANKLNSLIMTPVNGLGTAMTSFTAQNLGAGYTHRIRKGILQGLVMAAIIGVCSVGLGLLLTIDGAYLHIFLSADKVTADTIRFGNHFLYVDFSMYLLLCFLFVIRNCVQGIQRAPFVLWAGASELIARVAICLTLPALLSGGVVSAQSPELAFYALCAADPLAWLAADLALQCCVLQEYDAHELPISLWRRGAAFVGKIIYGRRFPPPLVQRRPQAARHQTPVARAASCRLARALGRVRGRGASGPPSGGRGQPKENHGRAPDRGPPPPRRRAAGGAPAGGGRVRRRRGTDAGKAANPTPRRPQPATGPQIGRAHV